jgi:hypothetical protein
MVAGAPNGAVAWAVDATPNPFVAANPFVSGPFSLNFNNGTDYAGFTSGDVNGTATMNATVNLATSVTPTFTFQCNYETETTGTGIYDTRFVEFSNNNFTTTVLAAQCAGVGPTGGINACAAMGTWHTHSVPLLTTYGTTVKVRFRFNSFDTISNSGDGWAIDDVSFNSTTGVGPGTPTQRVSPDNFQLNDD